MAEVPRLETLCVRVDESMVIGRAVELLSQMIYRHHFVMTGASLYSLASSLWVIITDPLPSQDS